MENNIPSLTPGKPETVQLSALIGASKLLNGTLDRDEILGRLMDLASRGLDADRAIFYLLDRARGELHSLVILGEDEKEQVIREMRLPLGQGLVGYVARTGETINVADADADARFNRQIDEQTGYHTRTVLAVPLHDRRGDIIGVVQVRNKRQGRFSDRDVRYLQALADHAALALENSRLHAALEAEQKRLSFLYRIGSLMSGEASEGQTRLRDVLLTVMEGVTEVLRVESSAILLWDQRRRRLVFVTVAGPKGRELMEIDVPLEGSIAGWVIQNAQAIIVNDVPSDSRHFREADAHTGLVTRSLLGVPVKVRDNVIGVLEAMNKQSGAPFNEADLQLAQTVANHTALAIQSARHCESLLRVGEHLQRRATTGLLDSLNLFRG